MKVLVYKVDKDPVEMEIENDFRAVQSVINGYIEPVRTHPLDMKRNIALVDEDARVKNLPPNFRATLDIGYASVLFGTVVIVGEESTHEGMKWADVNQ